MWRGSDGWITSMSWKVMIKKKEKCSYFSHRMTQWLILIEALIIAPCILGFMINFITLILLPFFMTVHKLWFDVRRMSLPTKRHVAFLTNIALWMNVFTSMSLFCLYHVQAQHHTSNYYHTSLPSSRSGSKCRHEGEVQVNNKKTADVSRQKTKNKIQNWDL